MCRIATMKTILFVILAVASSTNAFEPCPNRSEFRCHTIDRECIKPELLCDGKIDCRDGSDEKNCRCDPPEFYRCKASKKCISSSFLCDSHFDCPGNDDEENCYDYMPAHVTTVCSVDEYKCHIDDECIPLEAVCDGEADCADGADEKDGCKRIRELCPAAGFLCKNNRCLHESDWKCDGVNDCGDNSDEENCHLDCTLENGKFLCANNATCIPMDKVCDEKEDCSDGSDESASCKSDQTKHVCSTFKCPELATCNILSNGPRCICPSGFNMSTDGTKCTDINECLTFGVCSHGCFNMPGSYKCQCAPGFEIDRNNRTCHLTNDDAPLLLYAATKTINMYDLDQRQLTKIADDLNQVVGISYDEGFVYWTDISYQVERIMRARIDGRSKMETLFTAGLGKPEDLAIDYLTKNIYISDTEYQHIAVCSNDGRYCAPIITDTLHRPRSIVLYPQKGRLYYTDWGDMPMIGVAGMDGAEPRALVSTDLHWPNGLALDWPNERLYWADAKRELIESSKLDGSDRREVIAESTKHPYGLAVFNDRIYWSDWDSKNIQACDKFTGKNREILARDNVIYGVHVYHAHMDRALPNPCRDSQCSHICMLNMNNSYTCACPVDMKLKVDRHACDRIGKPNKILLGIDDRLVMFEHRAFGRHDDADEKFVNFHIDKMTYNSVQGNVIVADNQDGVIYEVDVRDFKSHKVIAKDVGNITALAYDHIADNLYWADAEHGTIEVYSFNTRNRATIYNYMSFDIPIALAATAQNGKLFVAVQSSKRTRLDVMTTDGRGPHYRVIEDGFGNGPIAMLPSFEMESIFWTDYDHGTVSYTDFKGEMRHDYIFNEDRPVSLTIVGDEVFWTTHKSMKLSWTSLIAHTTSKTMLIDRPTSRRNAPLIQAVTVTPKTISHHLCTQPNNGGCSHICIAVGKEQRSCLCPTGMVFADMRNSTCMDAYECFFRCGSGECINEAKRCDGIRHCVDRSDEEHCDEYKHHVTCNYDQFACEDGRKCIERRSRCNLNIDCDDKSDEKDCEHYNRNTTCNIEQFMCPNGRCIDTTSLCDGFNDCLDNADESENVCRRDKTCSSNEFRCTYGKCIPETYHCDGSPDCLDSSDEIGCIPRKCPSGMKRCAHEMCIDSSFWCDGNNDCGDFSDEADCEDNFNSVCDKKFFQCKSNRTMCLELIKRCDGYGDCPNGEDELDCAHGCQSTEFRCNNSECIRADFRCDGSKDCKDGSDESDCRNGTMNIHPHHYACDHNDEFKCANGECIPWEQVCDHKVHCTDESDENGLCDTACQHSECQHNCRKTPHGSICTCRDGFELLADKQSCRDINECINGDEPCAQHCENTVGSYRCSCYPGFSLSRDKISCKSTDAQMFLFYTEYDTIYRLRPHLQRIKSTNEARIVGLDMHFNSKLLYFTLDDQDALYEMNWTSPEKVNTVRNVGHAPTQIAVDWITDNVYFIDQATTIRTCHMAKKRCITLLTIENGQHIKSLAVDPLNHRLFYSSLTKSTFSAPKTRIVRHHLDGTKKQQLVEEAFFVASITCDLYKERVYYAGLDTHSIWSVNYEGKDRRLIASHNKHITRPIRINVHESHVYVLNSGSKMMAVCSVYGRKECKPFMLNVNQPDNLIVAQRSRQKLVANACADDKCSTICAPSDMGGKCVCDFGHTVGPGDSCNDVLDPQSPYRVQASFEMHDDDTHASGATWKSIIGYVSLILFVVSAMIGVYVTYKRYMVEPCSTISMHFSNPRGAHSSAQVQMQKPNEICIQRHRNGTELDNFWASDAGAAFQSNDDTKRLLP